MVDFLFDEAKQQVMDRLQASETEAEGRLLSASAYIQGYCNLPEVPDALYHTLVHLALRAPIDGEDRVQTIRRGDTTITYAALHDGIVGEDIKACLRRFRRIVYP